MSPTAITLDRWEPGNGTRYDLCLMPLASGLRMLCWPNAPTRAVGALVLQPDGFLARHYLAEKLNLDLDSRDLTAVLAWLGTQGYEVPS